MYSSTIISKLLLRLLLELVIIFRWFVASLLITFQKIWPQYIIFFYSDSSSISWSKYQRLRSRIVSWRDGWCMEPLFLKTHLILRSQQQIPTNRVCIEKKSAALTAQSHKAPHNVKLMISHIYFLDSHPTTCAQVIA